MFKSKIILYHRINNFKYLKVYIIQNILVCGKNTTSLLNFFSLTINPV